jgi:hypothetical protein
MYKEYPKGQAPEALEQLAHSSPANIIGVSSPD